MNQTGGEISVFITGVVIFALFAFFIVAFASAIYLVARRYGAGARPEWDRSAPSGSDARATPTNNVHSRKLPHYMVQDSPARSIDGVIDKKPRSKYRYKAKEYIMSLSEREFYKRLFLILGREYLIFPQIHLSTIFAHYVYGQNFKGALSTIQRKSVDYVLCDTSFRIVCAIELDDRSHNRSDRRERDDFVDSIFNDTKTPLVRVSIYSNINNEELYSSIKDCISGDLPSVIRLV